MNSDAAQSMWQEQPCEAGADDADLGFHGWAAAAARVTTISSCTMLRAARPARIFDASAMIETSSGSLE
jgi:hypothetical protein